MKVAEMFTTNAHQSQRVRNDEIDLFGLTHPGKKRTENEDHFLACTVHPEVIVHATSLPNVDRLPLRGRVAGDDRAGRGRSRGQCRRRAGVAHHDRDDHALRLVEPPVVP